MMSTGFVVLNLAYLALVSASLSRRMLYLRLLLAVGSGLFVIFGVIESNVSLIAWNALIGATHIHQLIRLLLIQRRSRTTEVEESIRLSHFPGLDRIEFRALWQLSSEVELEDERFIAQGIEQDDLFLILSGEVVVRTGGALTNTLGPGSVVGEMSRSAGGTATANCEAVGPVELRRWSHRELAGLGETCPAALLAMEYLVQRDLVAKILAGNQDSDDR